MIYMYFVSTCFDMFQHELTVLPAKSDSDMVFCLQLLSKTNLYTPLELTRMDRSLVY